LRATKLIKDLEGELEEVSQNIERGKTSVTRLVDAGMAAFAVVLCKARRF